MLFVSEKSVKIWTMNHIERTMNQQTIRVCPYRMDGEATKCVHRGAFSQLSERLRASERVVQAVESISEFVRGEQITLVAAVWCKFRECTAWCKSMDKISERDFVEFIQMVHDVNQYRRYNIAHSDSTQSPSRESEPE